MFIFFSYFRLKNQLQYGHGGRHAREPDSPALTKIQYLEELVCDLETAETKLKRRVQEAERNEHALKEKMRDAETSSSRTGKVRVNGESWEQKEKQFTQEQRMKELTAQNAQLREELEVLKKDDDLDKLAKRVSELQRTEKGLRLKVNLLESQQLNPSMDLSNLMDTPEDLLRQRIRELEKLEQHQRQQVAELERDREELHEIARSDKNTIHEFSVQVRELQLQEKILKEQLHRCEQNESLLQLQCDDLSERREEQEEKLRQAQVSERSMRAQLAGVEQTHDHLSMKLEHSQEDLQNVESKLRKRIEELQKDKRELRGKCDELTDRVADLEGAELSYKQKLRNIESHETQLKTRLSELEAREGKTEQRKTDLEHINDTLNDKLHALEEEKADLLFTISDLETMREESHVEAVSVKSKIAALEQKLAESERRKVEMDSRLDEFTSKEVSMQSRLGETERRGRELQENLEVKIRAESELKKKVENLEAEFVATDEKVKSASTFEKQLQFVRQQLEFHQRARAQVDEENQRLKEKLKRYEQAVTDKTMVQVPSSELEKLRQQEKLLDDLEKSVERLEASEKSLKVAVEKLREGKDACGHEFKLQELEAKLLENSILSQAHELLKENHEETRRELSQLKSQGQHGGDVTHVLPTSSKSIQAHLAETVNLTGLKPADMMYGLERLPEFKVALRSLGARFPEAYKEFVHNLSVSTFTNSTSHVRVTTDTSMVAKDEEVITPSLATGTAVVNTPSATASVLPPGTVRAVVGGKDHELLIRELVDTLPDEEVQFQARKKSPKNNDNGSKTEGTQSTSESEVSFQYVSKIVILVLSCQAGALQFSNKLQLVERKNVRGAV